MTMAKIRTAEAIAPMLSAFHAIENHTLKSVQYRQTEGVLDRIVLIFDPVTLIVLVDENDDTIEFGVSEFAEEFDPSNTNVSCIEPWSEFIGKPFGWGWVTVNQQGYCDGLLLSFSGIVPQIALNVIASSIKIATISAH
jgi:hypothetical protein